MGSFGCYYFSPPSAEIEGTLSDYGHVQRAQRIFFSAVVRVELFLSFIFSFIFSFTPFPVSRIFSVEHRHFVCSALFFRLSMDGFLHSMGSCVFVNEGIFQL